MKATMKNDAVRMSNVELPGGWIRAPFSAVVVDPIQRVPGEKVKITYVDIGSVDRDTKTVVEPQSILGKNAPSRARKVIQTGDVLVSTVRPNLNAVAVVESKYDGQFASTGFDVLRSPVMDSRWLFYSVRTPEFLDRMSELVQGALYPAVRSKDIRSFVIPIAPLAEQKRIADKLEVVLGRVDACRTRLDRVPALLKRFRQSVLAAATSGKLTEEWRNARRIKTASQCFQIGEDVLDVPKTWETGVLRDLLDPSRPLCYGVVQPGEESAGGSLLIRVQDLENGSVNVDDLRTISKRVDLEYKRSRILAGDLLISVVGTIGRTAIVPANLEANIARAIARLACRKGVESRWVNYWLCCDTLQWWLSSSSKEVARKTLNLSELGNTPVALPPSDEQQEIVRRVEDLFAFADRIEARLATAKNTVERLTPATLAKAFRGELVPQDPSDEPASVLLERIAALKDFAPAKKVRAKPERRS